MHPRLFRLFQALTVLAMGFAGCTPAPPPKIGGVRNYSAAFLCDGETAVNVQFMPFAAVLESDGLSIQPTQQPVADGYLYAGSGHSLHANGNDAIWTDGRGIAHRCRERIGDK